jgi:ABC-type multidrug transport system ATPase subunit
MLGPNGAGKTTTISMIVGLLRPDAGSVVVAGADPSLPATRRRIGICPQSVSLYPELTGRQNLTFSTARPSASRARRRFRRWRGWSSAACASTPCASSNRTSRAFFTLTGRRLRDE